MSLLSRRSLLLGAVLALASRKNWANPPAIAIDEPKRDFVTRANEDWRNKYEAHRRGRASLVSLLAPPKQLVPFKDWDYYYTARTEAIWTPNRGQRYKSVLVPVGFVTDLASIPQWAWSTGLRPEGAYAYAAIIHDYLYWVQDRPRDEADEIFLFAMEDSKVDKTLSVRIYNAVRLGGESAWNGNAKLKRQGEKRILRRFPADFTVSWSEWKRRPGVFR